MAKSAATQAKVQGKTAIEVTTDLSSEGVAEISTALRPLLADVFALYVKTKNFHWHMSGPTSERQRRRKCHSEKHAGRAHC